MCSRYKRYASQRTLTRASCNMRLVQIRNQAAPAELIPSLSIQRTKLIENQLDLLIVYIASVIPSLIRTINLPLTYNRL
jgi:hypothetical protein